MLPEVKRVSFYGVPQEALLSATIIWAGGILCACMSLGISSATEISVLMEQSNKKSRKER